TEFRNDTPGLDHFISVGRSKGDKSRDGAQRRKMLHRLMCRPIFADSNRIVGKNMDNRDFHQGAQADCRPAVVAKDQESRSKWSNLREGQTIEDGAHSVFANTEMKIPSGRILRAEISGAIKGQSCLA